MRAALRTLGLEVSASLEDAKSAFRQLAKQWHPDRTPPSPETLSNLAQAVAAIRLLEANQATHLSVTLTPAEACNGTLKTVTIDNTTAIFEIPAGTEAGQEIIAAGLPEFVAQVQISNAPASAPAPEADRLAAFIVEFVERSPSSRMANWLRKARSAA